MPELRPKWRRPWSGWKWENLSGVKSVGAGVFEHRIYFGPGYRIYFGKDGDALVILLGGGTKRRQRQDIETARSHWQDYKTAQATGGLKAMSLTDDGPLWPPRSQHRQGVRRPHR